MVNWKAVDRGRFFAIGETAALERRIFRRMEDIALENNFKYVSVPSFVAEKTIALQDCVPVDGSFSVGNGMCLSGSAEQGILEIFTGSIIDETCRVYAENQCFRMEDKLVGAKTLNEFKKMELFVFCKGSNWESEYSRVLFMAQVLLNELDIKWRTVDKTNDPGYHTKKTDIEVWTEQYGWMETHSCTYFADEQSRRFGITGSNNHTISCTAVASPRILIPIIDSVNRPWTAIKIQNSHGKQ